MPTIHEQFIKANVTKGRKSSFPVDTIVIHVMEGTMAGTLSWFNSPKAQASAHYGVGRDGSIVQYVREEDTAWHAGRVNAPTAAIIRERAGHNPNGYSIGIEHEGSGKDDLTDAQRAASEWLVKDIAARHSIPLTRRHIIGHREVFSLKSCPGKIDVDALVRAITPTPVPAPPVVVPGREPPRVVWSSYFNDYLVVTRYENDRDWHFIPMKQLPAGVRAQTPLSEMPNDRP